MTNKIFIAGEDPVTNEILRRLVNYCCPHLQIAGVLPARGSQLKSKIANFNSLSDKFPVVVLSDLDTDDCAPLAKMKLLEGISEVNRNLVINIAVDEAESWLFADTINFARYLKIDIDIMPKAEELTFGGPNRRMEMNTPIKSSLYFTHQLMASSKDVHLKEQIFTTSKAKC